MILFILVDPTTAPGMQLFIIDANQLKYWKQLQGRSKLFSIGGGGGGLKARAEGPRKFLNLESLKCHFLDFGEYLTEFW
jgi:hypothetical protein